MSDKLVCATCGGDEWRSVVQHGSYICMCPRCQTGPASSWLTIGPMLACPFRACVVDENWCEIELVAEGQGSAFAQAVGVVAGEGKRVELRPLAPA